VTNSDTIGVTILVTLLDRLSRGGNIQVAEFAAEHGFARATTFMVCRRLRDQGLLVWDAERGLAPGPGMLRLAWSALGLPDFAGRAEAVLRWLLSQVDGRAALRVDGAVTLELGQLRQTGAGAPRIELTRPLRGIADGRAVMLQLQLQHDQRELASFGRLCLERAALTLEVPETGTAPRTASPQAPGDVVPMIPLE
jgi:DNA-binding IclR family transcriptional regulator